jgi:hypothetical protein
VAPVADVDKPIRSRRRPNQSPINPIRCKWRPPGSTLVDPLHIERRIRGTIVQFISLTDGKREIKPSL